MFVANGALIYTALSTLHGEELENSYDASQVYNQRIAEARAQDELGWVADVTTRQEGDGERVVADFRDRDGAPIPGLEVRARFVHPFDKRRRSRGDPALPTARLTKASPRPLHAGRWTLLIEASRTAGEVHQPEQDHARGDRGRGLTGDRDAGLVGFRSPSRRRGGGDGPRRRGRPLRRLHQHDRKGPRSRKRRARRAGQSGEQARHRRMGRRRAGARGDPRAAERPRLSRLSLRHRDRSTASRPARRSACCAASASPPSAR